MVLGSNKLILRVWRTAKGEAYSRYLVRRTFRSMIVF